jgi:hypothetical protein
VCPRSESGYRQYTAEELDKFYQAYADAPIAGLTGEPSIAYVGRKCGISTKLVKRLRDDNRWERRRLIELDKIRREVDRKRIRAKVKKVDIYESLEVAGLNYHVTQVYEGPNEKKLLNIKPTDVIAFGKHVEFLKGNTGADNETTGQPTVNVVLNLGENGMVRKNGNGDNKT